MGGAVRMRRDHLEEGRLGDPLLLVGVAAAEVVRRLQEIAALRMVPDRLDAFAGDHHLRRLRGDGGHAGRGAGVDRHVHVPPHGLREGREEAIVVGLRDRVELVVVAAGAADRQAQERGAGRRGHVVEGVVAGPLDLVLRDLRREHAGADEPRRRQRERPPLRRQRRGVLVAGELPLHEGVVGQVGVERPDHEVAVVEGERPVVILLEPVALREPRDVEPVPRPALPETLVGQQAIDDLPEGVRRVVGDEGVDLLRRRRDADQVERHAADLRHPVGGAVRRDAAFPADGFEEAVHVVAAGDGEVRRGGLGQRPEGAELAGGGGNRTLGPVGRLRRIDERLVERRPEVDPLRECRDLRLRQHRGVQRHRGFVGVPDERHQPAFRRLAGHDGRAVLAAAEQRLPIDEAEPALGRVAAVTRQAALDEDRPDGGLEQLAARRHVARMGRGEVVGDRGSGDGDRQQRDGGSRQAEHRQARRRAQRSPPEGSRRAGGPEF